LAARSAVEEAGVEEAGEAAVLVAVEASVGVVAASEASAEECRAAVAPVEAGEEKLYGSQF
jgi:hypothetical protein